jgi:hypothetical protein
MQAGLGSQRRDQRCKSMHARPALGSLMECTPAACAHSSFRTLLLCVSSQTPQRQPFNTLAPGTGPARPASAVRRVEGTPPAPHAPSAARAASRNASSSRPVSSAASRAGPSAQQPSRAPTTASVHASSEPRPSAAPLPPQSARAHPPSPAPHPAALVARRNPSQHSHVQLDHCHPAVCSVDPGRWQLPAGQVHCRAVWGRMSSGDRPRSCWAFSGAISAATSQDTVSFQQVAREACALLRPHCRVAGPP